MRSEPRSLFAALLAWMLLSAGSLQGQDRLSARARTDATEVYVGQPFLYQIEVSGSDRPERPDLEELRADFTIEPAGEGANNSTQISIVNGRMSRVENRGYQFNFRLTPRREGRLTIPAVEVAAEGTTAATNPIPVVVVPPEEINDFKLRLTLGERTAYVGQPVVLTTTWYVGRSVDQFRFHAPVLDDDRFEVLTPRANVDPNRQVDIPIGDGRVTARRGRGRIDNFDFLTVSFDHVVVPKQAGELAIEPTVVSFRAIREGMRRRGFFDDWVFGDPFLNRGRTYETLSIPANRVALNVRPLPEEGRPANFSGLIGAFQFDASASPTDVSVGDPITLEVAVSGPAYLEYVRLPDLDEHEALRRGFQVSGEPASELRGRSKVFTQTVRARTPSIDGIPPLEFNYFDPRTGEYATVKTDPIPLEIRGARVLTAADAEGVGVGAAPGEVDDRVEGIAHQYEGADALVDQPAGLRERLRSPLWLTAFAAPPLLFFALLGWTRARGVGGDDAARRRRRALRELENELGRLRGSDEIHSRLLDALRRYLGAKLDRPAGSLTYADVEPELLRRGVDQDALRGLKHVFQQAEAGRYGGGALSAASEAELLEQARSSVRALEAAVR